MEGKVRDTYKEQCQYSDKDGVVSEQPKLHKVTPTEGSQAGYIEENLARSKATPSTGTMKNATVKG
jgi:hypothetical protein